MPRVAEACSTQRFVILGDGRAAVDGVGPSAYWQGILEEALATRPDVILNTGDFVKNGRIYAEWANYLKSIPPWPPIVGVRGNHDRGPHFDDLKIAYGDIYSLELGPLLLVGLDSEAPLPRFREMVTELDDILRKIPDVGPQLCFIDRYGRRETMGAMSDGKSVAGSGARPTPSRSGFQRT